MRFSSYPYFFTATIVDWKPLLKQDKFKDTITESLQFLVCDKRVVVYAFVIMNNHLHIIWQPEDNHAISNIQHAFMKYTAQMMIRELRNNHPQVLQMFQVDAADRKFQIWKRNPLSISLFSAPVLDQKINYIHNNPVKATLVASPEDYRYSSASFYYCNKTEWTFLSHYDG